MKLDAMKSDRMSAWENRGQVRERTFQCAVLFEITNNCNCITKFIETFIS